MHERFESLVGRSARSKLMNLIDPLLSLAADDVQLHVLGGEPEYTEAFAAAGIELDAPIPTAALSWQRAIHVLDLDHAPPPLVPSGDASALTALGLDADAMCSAPHPSSPLSLSRAVSAASSADGLRAGSPALASPVIDGTTAGDDIAIDVAAMGDAIGGAVEETVKVVGEVRSPPRSPSPSPRLASSHIPAPPPPRPQVGSALLGSIEGVAAGLSAVWDNLTDAAPSDRRADASSEPGGAGEGGEGGAAERLAAGTQRHWVTSPAVDSPTSDDPSRYETSPALHPTPLSPLVPSAPRTPARGVSARGALLGPVGCFS